MMKIYLARHGQDEDNKNGILNGQRDKPLTDLGVQQAETLAGLIKKAGTHFDVIYSSPLIRALSTAKIISTITNSPKPIINKLLTERNFGTMTGIKTNKIEELCAPNILKTETITYFLNPEGAETFPDLINRAESLLNELEENHTHKNILLVTHGDMGKMIYATYYNLPWKDVLIQFHFGNSELLLLAKDSPAEKSHIFSIEQYNP